MQRDVIVLGGGAGGLVCASGLAQLGLKVTLIEKAPLLGGDCLHYGCVPSKTLIHSAHVAHWMRQASTVGLKASDPEVELSKVNDRVAQVISQIQVHDSVERFESLGVEVLFGQARFCDKKTIEFNHEKMQAKRFIIATGSRPMIPPIPGLEDIDFLTNETIFKCRTLPEHLIVIGGGAIGVELSQAMARLGAKVTLLEVADRLLSAMDESLSASIQEALEQEGIAIHTGMQIESLEPDANDVVVRLQNAPVASVSGSHLLLAAGRSVNTEGLMLEKAGVTASRKGIAVNQKMRTKNRRIYAVGDVVDCPYKLTHMAEYQAGAVIANIAFKVPKKISLKTIPAVVYSHPEVAQVGETEQSLSQKTKRYQCLQVNFADIDRAIATNETHGFVKLLVRKGRIVGASMIGPNVGELLAEVTLAINQKIKIGHISATIHAYPTLSQVVRRTVNQYYGPKLFSGRTRALVSLLNKLP